VSDTLDGGTSSTVGSRLLAQVAVLGIFLLYVVPMLFVFAAAFKSNSQIATDPASLIFRPTLDAFGNILIPQLFRAMANSAAISLLATVVTVGAGAPMAYLLTRIDSRWAGLVVGVLIALQMTPPATSVIPLFPVLRNLHLLDSIPGVALAIAAMNLPFAILLLRPFFLSVPREVIEAAGVDGAGEFSAFMRIVVPIVRNGLSLIAILLFIGSWGEYIYSVSFLSSTGNFPLSVLLVQQLSFYGSQYNNLMALALVGSLPTIVAFVFVAKRLTGGLALGVGK
jgi:multiple sugar transport system permease protein